MCRRGQDVVREIFEGSADDALRGFVVWLPMLPGDSAEAAAAQAEAFRDRRLSQGWDPQRRVGDAFARMLKLRRTAWDVYLVFAPGTRWEEAGPPRPAFWMHQLTPDWGADKALFLDPGRLGRAVKDAHRGRRG